MKDPVICLPFDLLNDFFRVYLNISELQTLQKVSRAWKSFAREAEDIKSNDMFRRIHHDFTDEGCSLVAKFTDINGFDFVRVRSARLILGDRYVLVDTDQAQGSATIHAVDGATVIWATSTQVVPFQRNDSSGNTNETQAMMSAIQQENGSVILDGVRPCENLFTNDHLATFRDKTRDARVAIHARGDNVLEEVNLGTVQDREEDRRSEASYRLAQNHSCRLLRLTTVYDTSVPNWPKIEHKVVSVLRLGRSPKTGCLEVEELSKGVKVSSLSVEPSVFQDESTGRWFVVVNDTEHRRYVLMDLNTGKQTGKIPFPGMRRIRFLWGFGIRDNSFIPAVKITKNSGQEETKYTPTKFKYDGSKIVEEQNHLADDLLIQDIANKGFIQGDSLIIPRYRATDTGEDEDKEEYGFTLYNLTTKNESGLTHLGWRAIHQRAKQRWTMLHCRPIGCTRLLAVTSRTFEDDGSSKLDRLLGIADVKTSREVVLALPIGARFTSIGSRGILICRQVTVGEWRKETHLCYKRLL